MNSLAKFSLRFNFKYLSLTLISINLLLLLITRGDRIHAFELFGAARGLLAINGNLLEELLQILKSSFYYQYWSPANSLLFTIPSALLTQAFPSLYWGIILNLTIFIAILFVAPKLLNISASIFWPCILASPAIISYSLIAHPYLISPVITHTWSLCYIFRTQSKKAGFGIILQDIIVFILIGLLALQLYEVAKTFAGLFILAALSLKGISVSRRCLWSCLSVAYIFWLNSLQRPIADKLINDVLTTLNLSQGLGNFFKGYFVNFYLDMPLLLILAIISIIFLKQQRIFWSLYLAGVIILAILLGAQENASYLIPHRLLIISFVAAIIISKAYACNLENLKYKNFINIALGLGIICTTYINVKFAFNPREYRTLPYVNANIDWYINSSIIRDFRQINNLIDKEHGTHILYYGFSNFIEHVADPVGLPERLLLLQGFHNFNEKIFLIDSEENRYYRFSLFRNKLPRDLSTKGPPFFIYVFNSEKNLSIINSISKDLEHVEYYNYATNFRVFRIGKLF